MAVFFVWLSCVFYDILSTEKVTWCDQDQFTNKGVLPMEMKVKLSSLVATLERAGCYSPRTWCLRELVTRALAAGCTGLVVPFVPSCPFMSLDEIIKLMRYRGFRDNFPGASECFIHPVFEGATVLSFESPTIIWGLQVIPSWAFDKKHHAFVPLEALFYLWMLYPDSFRGKTFQTGMEWTRSVSQPLVISLNNDNFVEWIAFPERSSREDDMAVVVPVKGNTSVSHPKSLTQLIWDFQQKRMQWHIDHSVGNVNSTAERRVVMDIDTV